MAWKELITDLPSEDCHLEGLLEGLLDELLHLDGLVEDDFLLERPRKKAMDLNRIVLKSQLS